MIVLIGNPNCGKSALFNRLTNSKQKVGNFPGVTVEEKVGEMGNTTVVDLPGIYSLIPYTLEEKVTTDYLKNNDIELIINVVDINTLNRSLYLTSRLMELNIPMILVLNKDDGINRTVVTEDILSKILGVEVIKISVKNNKGIDDLKKLLKNEHNKHKIVFSKDDNIEQDIIRRYQKIDEICTLVIKKNKSKNINILLDNILLNKHFSVFISILFFLLIYYLLVNVFGNICASVITNIFNYFISFFTSIMNTLDISLILKDLILNGIISGISSIVSFIPQIIILMFIVSLLEDSGLIARSSFVFNNILKKIGLSGHSFSSLLLGSSCSSLAILSTRTLKDDLERKKTIFLIPFIPCSAKIPIIILITSLFFKNSFFIFISFYLLAIIIIIVASFIFKKSNNNYILEIPELKLPSLKIAFIDTIDKTSSFLKRICSIIMLFSIFNWFLISFDMNINYGVTFENSILYTIGNKLSFLVKPIVGTSDPKIFLSILSGLIAKEQVVSTMSVSKVNFISLISAYSFCSFNLFSIPCINTLTAIKKECGFKVMILYSILYIVIAYLVSIIVFRSLLWIL